MINAPPDKAVVTDILSTYRSLVDTVCSFLTVSTHHLLYLRRIYPPVSFLSARAYNYPVRQNRHPEVCEWINDAISAVQHQLLKSTVQTVALCIFECDSNEVLERWTFDLHTLPAIAQADQDVQFDTVDDVDLQKKVNLTDLEASFRAVISRLDTVSGKMRPLPNGEGAPECSFTMTIELKDDAPAPIGKLDKDERSWGVTEPSSFSKSGDVAPAFRSGGDPQQPSSFPIRRLEVGDLRMEMYVEESEKKMRLPTTHKTTLEKAAELSYGAGTEKFDPQNGYELEEPDVNKKPQGGASTDYQR